jgi:hypothetical protein
MSRDSVVSILGVLVIISPFSGLPRGVLEWALPVIGAAIVVIGFLYRGERRKHDIQNP